MTTTKFITFYSYKGGVGRTLALGNMAWEAALRGKRVVVVDFDLEAPGISSLKPFRDSISQLINDQNKQGGLFEMIFHYQENQTDPLIADSYSTVPITQKEQPDFGADGKIHIIPAGKEDSVYKQKLQGFDWDKFYSEQGGRDFFLKFRHYIRYEFDNPDLVLIDSRTGLTDIGGICTIMLPDRVVIVTGLNNQNLHGSKSIINSIEKYSELRAKDNYMAPIEIITVASHVPFDQETDLTRKRMKEAAVILNRKIDVAFPYAAVLSLEERLFIQDQGNNKDNPETLVSEYRRLYDLITKAYTKQEKKIAQKEQEFKNSRLKGKYEEALNLAKELIRLYEEEDPLSAKLLDIYYYLINMLNSKGKYEEILESIQEMDFLLKQGVEPDKISLDVLYNDTGAILIKVAINSEKQKKKSLLKQTIKMFQKAIEIKPDFEYAYNNWGYSSSMLAEIEAYDIEKKILYEQAIEKFKKALEIKPDSDMAYINWGNSLVGLAKILLDHKDKKNLLEEAIKKYHKAQEINPKEEMIYYNLGNRLSDLAKIALVDEEKKNLYKKSIEEYKKALEINPKEEKSYINWGFTLSLLAEIASSDEEKNNLLDQAIEKCEKALEINQYNDKAYEIYSHILGQKYHLTNSQDDLQKALQMAQKANSINEEPGLYNIACAYSLLREKDHAFEWLTKALAKDKLPSKKHLLEDPDLALLRDDPRFEKLLADYETADTK